MKLVIAAILFAGQIASAEVINVNVYQDQFELDQNIQGSVDMSSAGVVKVVSQYEELPNPSLWNSEFEQATYTRVLQRVEVVQVQLSYFMNDAGEYGTKTILANLPLSMFSPEDLTALRSKKFFSKKTQIIKKYIDLKREMKTYSYFAAICPQPLFSSGDEPIVTDCENPTYEERSGIVEILSVVKN